MSASADRHHDVLVGRHDRRQRGPFKIREPRRRPSATDKPQRTNQARGLQGPIGLLSEILQESSRSSWQQALHGHPVTGFILVLGGTTGLALLLYGIS